MRNTKALDANDTKIYIYISQQLSLIPLFVLVVLFVWFHFNSRHALQHELPLCDGPRQGRGAKENELRQRRRRLWRAQHLEFGNCRGGKPT